VFLPGHRIRLEVASEAAGHYRPAINRIFHDAAHPSRLILPIIER